MRIHEEKANLSNRNVSQNRTKTPQPSPEAQMIQMKKQENWFKRNLFNGRVINNSSQPVTVWSSDRGTYTIPAGSSSDRFGEDVDHIQDKNGQWYKIGWNTVTVDASGNVTGHACLVSGPGDPCP